MKKPILRHRGSLWGKEILPKSHPRTELPRGHTKKTLQPVVLREKTVTPHAKLIREGKSGRYRRGKILRPTNEIGRLAGGIERGKRGMKASEKPAKTEGVLFSSKEVNRNEKKGARTEDLKANRGESLTRSRSTLGNRGIWVGGNQTKKRRGGRKRGTKVMALEKRKTRGRGGEKTGGGRVVKNGLKKEAQVRDSWASEDPIGKGYWWPGKAQPSRRERGTSVKPGRAGGNGENCRGGRLKDKDPNKFRSSSGK